MTRTRCPETNLDQSVVFDPQHQLFLIWPCFYTFLLASYPIPHLIRSLSLFPLYFFVFVWISGSTISDLQTGKLNSCKTTQAQRKDMIENAFDWGCGGGGGGGGGGRIQCLGEVPALIDERVHFRTMIKS